MSHRVEDDHARGCFLIRNSKLEPLEATTQERASGLRRDDRTPHTIVSDAQLQAAARLKVALGSGRTAAITGIAEDDCPSEIALQIAQAFAATDEKPALIVTVGSPADSAGPPRVAPDLSVIDQAEIVGGNVYRIDSSALGGLLQQDVESSRKRLRSMLADFCVVLMDCGDFRHNATGILMASLTDGVVIAARAGKRRRHELLEVREDLLRLNIPLLGVFLTRGVSRTE